VQLIKQLAAAPVSQGLEHCIHLTGEYATKRLPVKPDYKWCILALPPGPSAAVSKTSRSAPQGVVPNAFKRPSL
jgi:hypothetical protein